MTEQEARQWLIDRFDSDAIAQLERLRDLVVVENGRQNLIARSTIAEIWSRHIVDSAQLVPLAEHCPGTWVDIGTGGGFPGAVVACLRDDPIVFVEPRRRRAEFLKEAVDALDLQHVTVLQASIEQVHQPAAVISARAVASVDVLLAISDHCARADTLWLLPRGAVNASRYINAGDEKLPMFHVEHSLTNPGSVILVGRGR